MTFRTLANVTAEATGIGELSVADADITLDETQAPYIGAHLTINLPDEETIVDLDPYADPPVRVVITATQKTNGVEVEREFDLILHEIELDADTATAKLTLESDEALLIDGGNATAVVDESAETYEASLRDIVDDVLDGYGASLEPGSDDPDFTVTWNVTNKMYNPTAGTNTTGWSVGSLGDGTLSRISATISGVPNQGYAFRATMDNASTTGLFNIDAVLEGSTAIRVSEGKTYTVSAWVRTSAAKSLRLSIQQSNYEGASIGTNKHGATATTVSNTWTFFEVTFTPDPGADYAGVYCYLASGSWTGGQTIDMSAVMFAEGDEAIPYFDGETTTDTYYSYEWDDTANASPSRRVRFDTRARDLLKLQPGQTHWDFLLPIVKTAGLRLFCDETRNWYLVNPLTYTVPGEVRVSESVNALAGTDRRSLQATDQFGDPLWFTGVVIRYRWLGEGGEQLEQFDAAGTGRKIHRLEVDSAFPGEGAAAVLLAQAEGRGRTQNLTARNDLRATPGMQLVSSLPGIPMQVGVVSSVKWSWSAEGSGHDEMVVKSRGLLDAPETAWLFAEGTWTEVTGIDWDDIDEAGE